MQSRSGELAMRPLPAVLLDLHEDLATGKLVLRRGKVNKTVDLVNGNPVSTASTPRDETLGHFLVASGVITSDQHAEAVHRATNLGGKLGEALVALQILTVEQLIDQLGKQARHKLVQALRWPQGAWRFDPSNDAIEGMQLRMVEVVLGGLRETAVEDLGRLARLDHLSFELTERGNRLRHELRRAFGERPLAALAAGAPIGELEKTFPDRAQARYALDAMLLCDAIVAKAVEAGLGTPATPPPRNTLTGVGLVPHAPEPAGDGDHEDLFERLFDDDTTDVKPVPPGARPIDPDFVEIDPEDSGIVAPAEIAAMAERRARALAASKALTAEHQRLQGIDHYATLLIDRDSSAEDVETGYQIKVALLERNTAHVTDVSDRAKLDEIRAAYRTAHEVLVDPRKRAAYDRELAGGELVQGPPAIDTELSFKTAEQHMARGQWPQAIGLLKTVIARSPGEADYHAALGWACWNAGQQQAAAGDAARDHINAALSIDPDHAAAHDYKGRIEAAQGVDDATALFHLERAIDLDPARTEAVAAIEQLIVARGDVRRLEKVLKRHAFRLRGRGDALEVGAWLQLARVYADHLDDMPAARSALTTARKLAPMSPEVAALAQRLSQPAGAKEPARAGWREALSDPQSGAALVSSTAAAGHVDAAFLAASTMVALGTADDAMAAQYDKLRVRGSALPAAPLTREQWAQLRHKDDGAELGALVELVAPAIHALAPMTLAEGELDPSARLDDDDLPPVFGALRARLGELLGVRPAAVYTRPELGSQIHVVAADPPVLVAGDEVLRAPERPELVFRLARALTFCWPGRAVGASRPGRVLKAVVLAVVRDAAGTEVGLEDTLAPRAAEAIGALPNPVRGRARGAALRLLSKTGGGLNLSLWSRSLSRTADRAALLLCGDVPAAFAGAKEVGELDKDLVEFAFGAVHVALRRELGLARG